MAIALNLEKSTKALSLCLEKSGVKTPPSLDVAFILDVSGSFEDEHHQGITNDLLTRLVPWGALFDPDKKLDVITFSNGKGSVHHVGTVTTENYEGFVRREIIRKVPGWNGGTDYSYALEEGLRLYGWLDNSEKKAGFFGKLMGQKDRAPIEKRRSLILFVTDGDNSDYERTIEVLKNSESRSDEVYFLFLAVSNQGSTFPFIEKLGNEFNNTGLATIKNIRSFVQKTDDELNGFLLQQELVDWLKV